MRKTPSLESQIFKDGSTTYYWSSLFFPAAIREDVFKLYSFVRVADNYVDKIPQDTDGFNALVAMWNSAINSGISPVEADSINDRVVSNMLYVTQKYDFDPSWVVAFLDAMRMDIDGRRYQTLEDTLEYVYGSAEVIGLMMAKIMGLPDKAAEAARLQGRAMQWINFLRDVAEDIRLDRQYMPASDLKLFGLSDLSTATIAANTENFNKCIRFELDRYDDWQHQANAGFHLIPRRLRIPLETAVDMYNWTAAEIRKNPQLVLDGQLKPTKSRVIQTALRHSLRS